MTIASAGVVGKAGGGDTSSNSIVITATAALNVGDLAVLMNASNNMGTVDGDNGDVTSVADSAGNTWTKAREHSNTLGGVSDGVTCSVWWTRATAALAIGGTITVTYVAAFRDKAVLVPRFTVGGAISVAATEANATSAAADWGSMTISGLPSKHRLYLRTGVKEANVPDTTNLTPTAGFTAMDTIRSRDSAAAVITRGEFKIATSTGETSSPSLATVADNASIFVAFDEAAGGGTTYNDSLTLASGVASSLSASLAAGDVATIAASAGMAPSASADMGSGVSLGASLTSDVSGTAAAAAALAMAASADMVSSGSPVMAAALGLATGAGIVSAETPAMASALALAIAADVGANASASMIAAMAIAATMAQAPGETQEATGAATFGASFAFTAEGDEPGAATGTVALATSAGIAMSAQVEAGDSLTLGAATVLSPTDEAIFAGALALAASVATDADGGLVVTGEIALPAAAGQGAADASTATVTIAFAAEFGAEQAANLDAASAIDLAAAAAVAVASASSGDGEIRAHISLTGVRRDSVALTGTMKIRVALTGIVKR